MQNYKCFASPCILTFQKRIVSVQLVSSILLVDEFLFIYSTASNSTITDMKLRETFIGFEITKIGYMRAETVERYNHRINRRKIRLDGVFSVMMGVVHWIGS